MEINLQMLARTGTHCQTPRWKRQLATSYTRPADLLDFLGLDRRQVTAPGAAVTEFPFLVPHSYVALMERGNPDDPLLRQVLPIADELADRPGFSADPVGDLAAARTRGLLQKYRGRALLVTTGACAIHCRYCFRRHFPYGTDSTLADEGSAALAIIAGDATIDEVILSGGDPLMIEDGSLGRLMGRLSNIPHIKRVRLHSRMPIVLPARVTDELCCLLADSRPKPVMVLHTNHARELGPETLPALRRMKTAGITLLNQSVLLRGINDRADTLADLSVALFANDVLPYYLHLLDKVRGSAHFGVSQENASGLIRALRERLPGYLVPRLVREESGTAYKIPVC
jgi:EF-P beta-lysylation protein EpmB